MPARASAPPSWRSNAKRDYDLRRRYGITESEYQRLFDEQGGLCLVCRMPEQVVRRGRPVTLMVEHSHITGQVRGLVCYACNAAVMWLERFDPDEAAAAVTRLTAHINAGKP